MGIDDDWRQPRKQAVARYRVYEIGVIEARGGTIKATADIGNSKCVVRVQGGIR
jgi:hypothetical protein